MKEFYRVFRACNGEMILETVKVLKESSKRFYFKAAGWRTFIDKRFMNSMRDSVSYAETREKAIELYEEHILLRNSGLHDEMDLNDKLLTKLGDLKNETN